MIYTLMNPVLNMNKYIDHIYLRDLCNAQGLTIVNIYNSSDEIVFFSEVDTFDEININKINQACQDYLPHETTMADLP